MQEFLLIIDRISAAVGKLFAWSILILTFAVSYEVFSRYVLGQPTTWAFDVSYILYGTLFIMAGAYTLSRNGHVRADVIQRLMPVRWQAGIDLILYILFFFPAILAFLYSGYHFADLSWQMNEHSSNSPAGPPLYHFKSLIPFSGFFLLLQGIAETIRCAIALKTGEWTPRLHDVEELEEVILEQAHAAAKKEAPQ
ncbi:MAG: TRAP transporter small permease subunit [Rhodospirillales bacterium]|nr:TRAP transporter small permease subunit [Rhodospirillales bacterium]